MNKLTVSCARIVYKSGDFFIFQNCNLLGMAKDWIKFFKLVGDPFNTIPLQTLMDFRSLFVKTDDINRHIDPLLIHFEQSKPFLRVIVGPRGSGKSTILHYAISHVKSKKNVVACYVSHQPSVIDGVKDPVFGIGNDTATRILVELTRALLSSQDLKKDAELAKIARTISSEEEGGLPKETYVSWSYSFVYNKLQQLLAYIQERKILALIAIDNYDKHDEDMAISFLRSNYAQPLFEELQGAGVSIFTTADVDWSEKVQKEPDLNFLGQPIQLSPMTPIEAKSLINKRIAAKLVHPEAQDIFDENAMSSITVREDGITRNIMEICRICMIEAANRDQKHVSEKLANEILRSRELRARKYYELIKTDPKAIAGLTRLVSLWGKVGPDTYRRMLHGIVDIWESGKTEDEISDKLREERLIYLSFPKKRGLETPPKLEILLKRTKKSKKSPLQIPVDIAVLLENISKRYSLRAFVDWLAKGEPSVFFVPTTREQETVSQVKAEFHQLLPLFTRGDVRLMLRNAQTAYNSWCAQIEGGDYDVVQVLSDMWTCLWNLSLCAYYATKVLMEEKTIRIIPKFDSVEMFLMEQKEIHRYLPTYAMARTYYLYSEKEVPIDPMRIEEIHGDSQAVVTALIELCKNALPFIRKLGTFPSFKVKNAEQLAMQLSPHLKRDGRYLYVFMEGVSPSDFLMLCWLFRNYVYALFCGKDESVKSYGLDIYDLKTSRAFVFPSYVYQQLKLSRLSSEHMLRFYNIFEFCSYLAALCKDQKVHLMIFSKTQLCAIALVTKNGEIIATLNYSRPEYGSQPDFSQAQIENYIESAATISSADEKEIRTLSDEVAGLMSQCNSICTSKSKPEIFKITNKMFERITDLGKPVSAKNDFGNLIDALYEIIYEGSGSLNRIPERLKKDDSVGLAIKFLRADLRHDLEHGKPKEIQIKRGRLARIYKKYTGMTSISSLQNTDFPKFQLILLKEVKLFLENLKKHCIEL